MAINSNGLSIHLSAYLTNELICNILSDIDATKEFLNYSQTVPVAILD